MCVSTMNGEDDVQGTLLRSKEDTEANTQGTYGVIG